MEGFKLSRPPSCPLHVNFVVDLINHFVCQWNLSLVRRLFSLVLARVIHIVPIAPIGTSDCLVRH